MRSRGCSSTTHWARTCSSGCVSTPVTSTSTRRSGRSRSPSASSGRSRVPPAATDQYHYGTGRRKTAVARVRLVLGDGVLYINGKPPSEYFGRRDLETVITQPLRITETMGRYVASIKVEGGGIAGQAGAICHGIARA